VADKTNDSISPDYYKVGKRIEVIDFIIDQQMDYLTASACKYLCRWQHKHLGNKVGQIEDLRKARFFIEKQIEEQMKDRHEVT
jgi:hypothetical protein